MNVVKVMSATDALASVWNGGLFKKTPLKVLIML